MAGRKGKALSDIPALKPYRGKPAVRNFRGGDGNVGIIRSPVRAIALPDNRHEAEEEEALQERSSDSLDLESCAATARDPAKRGHEAEAISLAEGQSAPWPKAYALLGVATALINQQREAAHYWLNSSP